jgi:hypothetical protein
MLVIMPWGQFWVKQKIESIMQFLMLVKLCQDTHPEAISYASRTLLGSILYYATTEKELLAVVFAIDKFRSYLVGAKVIVYTDHASLK